MKLMPQKMRKQSAKEHKKQNLGRTLALWDKINADAEQEETMQREPNRYRIEPSRKIPGTFNVVDTHTVRYIATCVSREKAEWLVAERTP